MPKFTLVLTSLLAIGIAHSSIAGTTSTSNPRGFFSVGEDRKYNGLTPQGLSKLKEQRDLVRHAFKELNQKMLHARSAVHAVFVARMFKGHVFIYGPPGAAKSFLSNKFLELEDAPPFETQLHQAMTEQSITGGQDFEAAKHGEYVINTDGSLAMFKTAILDEIDKGNPAVLATLLGIMQERKIRLGKKVVAAVLQSLFATSNAILPGILESFRETGQLSTAAALLNRFHFKVYLYNWLPQDDQKSLSRNRFQDLWKEAIEWELNEPIAPLFQQQQKIDWEVLRHFALYTFTISDETLDAFTHFADEMRSLTNHEIGASKRRFAEDPESEQFVYFPSADYTERLRQIVLDVVHFSAFLDFLLSPLADDEMIDQGFLNKQVELQPSSLWRSYLILTTIFSGKASLENTNGVFAIQFKNEVDKNKLRDDQERALLKMIETEQERFKTQYAKIANYEGPKAVSTGWLGATFPRDLEELLQPNKESDRLRRDKPIAMIKAQEEERLAKIKAEEELKRHTETVNSRLPEGEYLKSCKNCRVDKGPSGRDVLWCECPKDAGGWKSDFLFYNKNCRIVNRDGNLECAWY